MKEEEKCVIISFSDEKLGIFTWKPPQDIQNSFDSIRRVDDQGVEIVIDGVKKYFMMFLSIMNGSLIYPPAMIK